VKRFEQEVQSGWIDEQGWQIKFWSKAYPDAQVQFSRLFHEALLL